MLIIRIINDTTGPDDAANYDYVVHVNRTELARGRVTNHDRADGWRELVKRVAEDEE